MTLLIVADELFGAADCAVGFAGVERPLVALRPDRADAQRAPGRHRRAVA